jgi:hypothetical protein
MDKTNGESATQSVKVCQGQIIDQMVTAIAQDDMRVVLTVRVTSELNDPQDQAAGREPCTPKEVEVWLNLAASDEKRLRMTLRDLERLGFADDDLSKLHPDHPQFCSLVGKDVHVRCKVLNGIEYWNLAWPLVKVSLDKLQEAAAPLKARIAALRNKTKAGVKPAARN